VGVRLFANIGDDAATPGKVDNYGKLRLYSFRVYNAGKLEKCFLPCKDGDKVGLMEILSQTVYTNLSGKADFQTGGDIVANPQAEDIRVTAQGAIECRVRLHLSDVTATIDGDAADEKWFAKGTQVSIKATVPSTVKFGGWKGDTAYISQGAATDADITLTVDGPVELSADVVRTEYHGIKKGTMDDAACWKVKDSSSWVTPASVDYTTGQSVFVIKSQVADGHADYSEATLPANTAFKVYGILWNRNWGTFEIKTATGASLDIGAGGMNTYSVVAGDRGYYISAPVTLSADQTWTMPHAQNLLYLNRSIQGEGVTVTLAGPGYKYVGSATSGDVLNWKRTVLAGGGFVLRNRKDLLPKGHEIVFAGTAAAPATLNLTTFDQTLEDAMWFEEPGTCANNSLGSSGPASKNNVIFTGTPRLNPTGFGGALSDGAGVTWNPSSEDATFVFTNAVSSTLGRLRVLNGTMRIAEGASFTSLAGIDVGASAVLDIAGDAGAISGTELTVASGGKVRLAAGVNVVFDTAQIAGTGVSGGVYTKDTATWIEGEGSLTVAGNVWTAGGGSDTAIDNWANWGGVALDLTGGGLSGVFAAAGALCTVPAALSPVFRGIIFQGTQDFSIEAEDGASISVGSQGIQTAGASAARTFSVKAPVTVTADQFLVAANKDNLVLSNVVAGASTLTKDGTGELHLWGDNTFSGTLNVLNGRVWAHSDTAFGSTEAHTVLTQNKGYVTLDGVTTHEGFMLTKGFTNFIEVPKGKVGHVYGLLDNPNGGNWGLSVSGELHVHGGAYGSGNFAFNNLHVDDVPLHLTDRFSANGSIYLNVSSNWVGNNHTLMYSGCRIYCRAPYAYYRGPRNETGYTSLGKTAKATYITRIQFSSTNVGIFDLGGYDQETCQLLCSSANSANSCVTSSVPAQLYIYRDKSDGCSATDAMAKNYVKFVDAAGCTISCFGNYAIEFLSVSSTTGRLEVADMVKPTAAASVLTIGSTGGWPKASEVRVTGGKLVFTHGASIGKKTDVTLDARNGTLQLDNAAAQVCRWINVWNAEKGEYVRLAPGDYGGASCSAVPEANRLKGLAGTGILRSLGNPGLRIVVR